MLDKIQKFRALALHQKKYLIQAYLLLGLTRFAILTVSFKRLSKLFNTHPSHPPLASLDEAKREQAEAIGEAVRLAARHTLWDSNCLVQTLTAQRMLKQQHIAGMFFLGVKKDQRQLQAHAWLACDGQILTGEAGHKSYTVVSTFSWL